VGSREHQDQCRLIDTPPRPPRIKGATTPAAVALSERGEEITGQVIHLLLEEGWSMLRKSLAAIPAVVLALLAWTASTHAGDTLRLGGTAEDASLRTLELRPSDQADTTPVHLIRRWWGGGFYRPYWGFYRPYWGIRPYWGFYRPFWRIYRPYWGFYPGYVNYGYSGPVVGFNISVGQPYSYYAPPVYSPPVITDPCSCSTAGVVGTTSSPNLAVSSPPATSATTIPAELLHAPTPLARPTPKPAPMREDQTFPYDRDVQPPVPLPGTQPAPLKTLPGGRVVSQPQVWKYVYAAYGEKPRVVPPAQDNPLPEKDRLVQKENP
jgi:hypothetical protein